MRFLKYWLPIIIFLAVIVILWRGLFLHPTEVPSPMINKATPQFRLPTLSREHPWFTQTDFKNHITILHVWATWCDACQEEQEFLLTLVHDKRINLVGYVYKDKPSAAHDWLTLNNNPYQSVIIDQTGDSAIDWGIYGTPETFIIDQHGIIRYKQIGIITEEIWQQQLSPLIDTLIRKSS